MHYGTSIVTTKLFIEMGHIAQAESQMVSHMHDKLVTQVHDLSKEFDLGNQWHERAIDIATTCVSRSFRDHIRHDDMICAMDQTVTIADHHTVHDHHGYEHGYEHMHGSQMFEKRLELSLEHSLQYQHVVEIDHAVQCKLKHEAMSSIKQMQLKLTYDKGLELSIEFRDYKGPHG